MTARVFLVVVLYLLQHVFKVESCEVKVEKVGCFHDTSRPLDKLLLYRRNNFEEDEFSVFLPRFLCDCAVKARLRHYKYIGLQFYAECWSSNQPLPHYDRDGSSKRCWNKHYKKCKAGDAECAGAADTNFVYKIIPDSTPPTSSTPSPTLGTPPHARCIDHNNQCPDNKIYCNDGYPEVLASCPKTCGKCK